MTKCNKCGDTDPVNFYAYLPTHCKKCQHEYQLHYRRRNASARVTKDKKYSIKKRYGITPEEFERLHLTQDERCAICRRLAVEAGIAHSRQHLHIDHDHATGKVRGLLCNSCNRALGYAQDDPDILEAMAVYLRRSRESVTETAL
jgi:hypothetical protein